MCGARFRGGESAGRVTAAGTERESPAMPKGGKQHQPQEEWIGDEEEKASPGVGAGGEMGEGRNRTGLKWGKSVQVGAGGGVSGA